VIIGYQAEGTTGRKIVDGAKTVRLFGEEIAVRSHIHTLGGFSAHADQKGLLEWLSRFKNPQLEVFVNHGEEKISVAMARRIQQQFPFRVSVPQWREKRVLFSAEEGVLPEKVGAERKEEEGKVEEEGARFEERLSHLIKELNRNHRKLSRKLKWGKTREKPLQESEVLRRLAALNAEMEKLESEL